MPRFARLVVPDYPHHVTQRGSRRQQVFFRDSDYIAYRDLLAEYLPKARAEIWAYCLMPNHVHLIVVPHNDDSLARLFRETHAHYARRVNRQHGWTGHLWQERFHSFVMDESHLLAAARYVELNPVRAGLCMQPSDWPWSSVHYHLQGYVDKLVAPRSMAGLVGDWQAYLDNRPTSAELEKLRRHSSTGRPAGDARFVAKLEALTGRRLIPKRPGPTPKDS